MTGTAGYDIAKEFHRLAILDERGRLLLSHRVDNGPEAIEHSIAEPHAVEAEHGPTRIGSDILAGIAGLLAAMLPAEGPACVAVPGLTVNRARRATRGGENKSDPPDAEVIFTSADAPAAAAGPAPVPSQSGKVRYSRSATGGDKALKRVLYQAASCSIQRDPASRTFYDRKHTEGKRHHQALITLARRKINARYAILRDRQPYQARPPLRLAA